MTADITDLTDQSRRAARSAFFQLGESREPIRDRLEKLRAEWNDADEEAETPELDAAIDHLEVELNRINLITQAIEENYDV